ncbi:MAG: MFS transporter, partial [Chloroflexi bacterium]|nr:MFS transporter [Chloroflexota bacterium]
RRRVQGIFFGWWIVLSACVIQALNQGLLGQGFTVYFLPLQAEFGWSRTLLSAGYSLSHVESGVLGPFEGWFADRFGPRRVVLIGVVLLGAGFILLSMTHSIGAFFVAFLVMSAGSSLCGFLPLSVAVLNWFVRKRSLALGIAMAGAGIGGVIVTLVAWSVTTQGWRTTALASGFALWLIGIPISLLLRHKPEKYGHLPDGDSPASPEGRQENLVASSALQSTVQDDGSFSTMEALKTRTFWLIAVAQASAVLTVSAVSLHLAPHLVQQLGISLKAAGSVVALLMIVSTVGRVVGGFLADRTNKRVLLVVSMLSHTIGLLMLAYATSMLQVFLFTIFHGMGWGARAPTQNAIRAEYFGRKSIGLILGLGSVIVTIASIIAPIFAGWLTDLRGDYRLAFTILAIFTAFGSLGFALAGKPVRKSHVAGEGAVVH